MTHVPSLAISASAWAVHCAELCSVGWCALVQLPQDFKPVDVRTAAPTSAQDTSPCMCHTSNKALVIWQNYCRGASSTSRRSSPCMCHTLTEALFIWQGYCGGASSTSRGSPIDIASMSLLPRIQAPLASRCTCSHSKHSGARKFNNTASNAHSRICLPLKGACKDEKVRYNVQWWWGGKWEALTCCSQVSQSSDEAEWAWGTSSAAALAASESASCLPAGATCFCNSLSSDLKVGWGSCAAHADVLGDSVLGSARSPTTRMCTLATPPGRYASGISSLITV